MKPASVMMLMALSVALVSCGGDSDKNPGSVITSAPVAPTQGTGFLVVTATDPDGKSLTNFRVTIFNESQNRTVAKADSGSSGVASFNALPAAVRVSVSHPLGDDNRRVEVRQAGPTTLSVAIQPRSPTFALLSASVPAEGISADRTELDLHVTIVASALTRFTPSSYGFYTPTSPPTPLLRLRDCSVWLDSSWLDSSHLTPSCDWKGAKAAVVSDYDYDPIGTPAPAAAQEQYNVLLLLDQSRRATDYDPDGLRTFAAKHFIRRARSDPQADLIAVAGFAGRDADASSPPLLQRLPLWVASNTATVFSGDRFAQEGALDILQPLVGGSAPVFDALRAALTLTAAETPATGRRGIVALLGGDDDSVLSESQRQAALASLRQLRDDAGVQPILIAGRLDENSSQRLALAELAAALRAPIIYAGYPRNWSLPRDGLYGAVDLAADLLARSALPTVKAVFRMKSDQPGGFQRDSMLHGILYVESDVCDMGCAELPLQFAAEIP